MNSPVPNGICRATLTAALAKERSRSPQRTRNIPSHARVRKDPPGTRQHAEVIQIPDDEEPNVPSQGRVRKNRLDTDQRVQIPPRAESVQVIEARVRKKPPNPSQRVRKTGRAESDQVVSVQVCKDPSNTIQRVTQIPDDEQPPPRTIKYDEAARSCFASGRANRELEKFWGPSVCADWNYDCFPEQSPPKDGQVIGNHSLSIALGQLVPEEMERRGFHLIPISSFIPGDHFGQIYIPDRFDSTEALMFCGFDERTADSIHWKWERNGRKGKLVDAAKEHVKAMATAKGFNPWVAGEIGESNFWKRMNELSPKLRRKLVKKFKPEARRRYAWEVDWYSSLVEIGIDVKLIQRVNDLQFNKMREQVLLSQWVWNWITARWEDLLGFENRIHDIWQGKNDAIERQLAEAKKNSPIDYVGRRAELSKEFGRDYFGFMAAQEEEAEPKVAPLVGFPEPAALMHTNLHLQMQPMPKPKPKHSREIRWEDYFSEDMYNAEEYVF
jgi:hypothetical protein